MFEVKAIEITLGFLILYIWFIIKTGKILYQIISDKPYYDYDDFLSFLVITFNIIIVMSTLFFTIFNLLSPMILLMAIIPMLIHSLLAIGISNYHYNKEYGKSILPAIKSYIITEILSLVQ